MITVEELRKLTNEIVESVSKSFGYKDIVCDVLIKQKGGTAIAIDGESKQKIYESDNHRDVLQKAIDFGGAIVVKGDFTITQPLIPRSNTMIVGQGAIFRLSNGVRSLFKFDSAKALENFEVKNIAVHGNRNELSDDEGDNYQNAYLFNIFAASIRNVKLENIVVKDYFGCIAKLWVGGSGTIEDIVFRDIRMYNGGSVTPNIRNLNEDAFVHRNIVLDNLYLWNDDETHNILKNYAMASFIIGIDGLYISKIYARKSTDGLLLNIWKSRNVKIGKVVNVNGHDYALGLDSVENVDVDVVVAKDPQHYGALSVGSQFSDVRNVRIGVVYVNASPSGWEAVRIQSKGYPIQIVIDELIVENTGIPPIRLAPDNGDVDVTIRKLRAVKTGYTGIYIEPTTIPSQAFNARLVIEDAYVEDAGYTNAPDNDHKTAVFITGICRAEVLIRYLKAVKKDNDYMRGITSLVLSGHSGAERRIFVERLDGINLDADVVTYEEISGAHRRAIVKNKVYSSLPPTDVVGDEVLYYDGANYYIAKWNGSSWIKVALS